MSEQGSKKTVVVTGATAGIGRETAIALARGGAHVIVTGRDAARGEAGLAAIRHESSGGEVDLVLGDLASLAGVLALAEALAARCPRIDVLINNAGAYCSARELNADGLELGFATNVVAPYGLTRALLPCLEAAGAARVVNVTGGDTSTPLDPSDLQAERAFRGIHTYSHSKRALDAMSFAMARELAPRGVFLNVVYPGQALTSMTRSVTPASLPFWLRPFWGLLITRRADDQGASARKASRSSVFAATAPELEGTCGAYLDTKCRPAKPHRSVADLDNQRSVYEAVQRAWGA